MSQFHHRDWHSSIAFGNYLYIDGGEVATWNGHGTGLLSIHSYFNTTGDINAVGEPNTYSIDLTTSWTNQTVPSFAIDKAAPVLIREALWPDTNGEVFYAYNGAYSDASGSDVDYTNRFWQFSPSGNDGVWSTVSSYTGSNFSNLSRTGWGSYFSGDGVGFALGGARGPSTDASLTDSMLVPGLVMYNTTSHEWFNMSSESYPPNGMSLDGAGQFVSSFGSNGLLFFLGGSDNVDETTYISFDSVSMYDPMTQHWATQSVSGDLPQPCSEPCVVGAAGDNGTYEIFLYGGLATDAEASVAQGAVHVLTLPAFRWLKQTATPTLGRTRHSCNVIGNRQMVVVGGLPITIDSGLEYIPPDPWPSGIGIFDLSAFGWASEYDANAATYVTPDIVKEYYRSNSRYPSWSNAEIESWFTVDVTQPQPRPSETASTKSKGTNIGAIVGGTIGGVALLLAIGLAIWFLRWKKKKGRRETTPPVAQRRAEVDGWTRYEIGTNEKPGEAGSTPIYELPHRP